MVRKKKETAENVAAPKTVPKQKPKAKPKATSNVLTAAQTRECKQKFFSTASKDQKDAIKSRNADIRKTIKDRDLGLTLALITVI